MSEANDAAAAKGLGRSSATLVFWPRPNSKSTASHDEALAEMVNQLRIKLLGAEIMVGLKRMELPGVDFASAKRLAASAHEAIKRGQLGYAIVAGTCG